jgi:hypothetical protein
MTTATTRASGTIRVHPENASQMISSRQLIATISGGHSAIPVVARRTRSKWTKNPKMTTKGTKGAT